MTRMLSGQFLSHDQDVVWSVLLLNYILYCMTCSSLVCLLTLWIIILFYISYIIGYTLYFCCFVLYLYFVTPVVVSYDELCNCNYFTLTCPIFNCHWTEIGSVKCVCGYVCVYQHFKLQSFILATYTWYWSFWCGIECHR